MFESLFGQDLPLWLKGILAFVVVMALILVAGWLLRRFGGAKLGAASSRGRQPPRLAVIDTVFVEGRRRLILIRRDNVEHLILIGGPTDVVIEQNIVRAVPVTPPREAAGGRAQAPDAMPRAPEAGPRPEPRPAQHEPGWTPEPARGPRPAEPTWTPEPAPAPVARSPRPSEPRVQPPMDLPPRPQGEPAPAMRGAPDGARGRPSPLSRAKASSR